MAQKIPLDWKILQDNKGKISILVDNPLPQHKGEGKESYVGYILGYTDDFLVLETPQNSRIAGIAIRWSMILSVWVYKE